MQGISGNAKKWCDLSFKDKTAYVTCIVSFFLGWLLIGAGFVVPPTGEISGSVLSGFGMALGYTATVLGISMYFKSELIEFKEQISKKMNDYDRDGGNDNQ